MRRAYLRPVGNDLGCRGGVGSSRDSCSDDFALEIGSQCHADPEMIALSTLIDEVREYLESSSSPIAALILSAWMDEAALLTKSSHTYPMTKEMTNGS